MVPDDYAQLAKTEYPRYRGGAPVAWTYLRIAFAHRCANSERDEQCVLKRMEHIRDDRVAMGTRAALHLGEKRGNHDPRKRIERPSAQTRHHARANGK